MYKSSKEKPNVSEIDDLISRNFDIKKVRLLANPRVEIKLTILFIF